MPESHAAFPPAGRRRRAAAPLASALFPRKRDLVENPRAIGVADSQEKEVAAIIVLSFDRLVQVGVIEIMRRAPRYG